MTHALGLLVHARSPHIFCAVHSVQHCLSSWQAPALNSSTRTSSLGLPVASRLAVWRMTRATFERSSGGSCSQYSCSVPFPSLSWYKSSQYPFYLFAICAASVKFSLVADWVNCRCGWNIWVIDLIIWTTNRKLYITYRPTPVSDDLAWVTFNPLTARPEKYNTGYIVSVWVIANTAGSIISHTAVISIQCSLSIASPDWSRSLGLLFISSAGNIRQARQWKG